MSHLEDLLVQFYSWQGYYVRRNVRVGLLEGRGGWEMELDIVAYKPESLEVLHLEPSIDGDAWVRREERFIKKFRAGQKYIFTDVFKGLNKETKLRQVAILVSRGKARESLAGGEIKTIDEVIGEIKAEVAKVGIVAKRAIPEEYPLLRTIQFVINGFLRP